MYQRGSLNCGCSNMAPPSAAKPISAALSHENSPNRTLSAPPLMKSACSKRPARKITRKASAAKKPLAKPRHHKGKAAGTVRAKAARANGAVAKADVSDEGADFSA